MEQVKVKREEDQDEKTRKRWMKKYTMTWPRNQSVSE